jgi:iron complex transport system permease protein
MNKNALRYFLLAIISAGIIALYLLIGDPGPNIIMQIRIPRLILTLLTGMVLAGVGSVYQMMLANPLAEPYILGISSGSAFGSILAGVLGAVVLMPLGGFIGAMLTMLLVWTLAQKDGSFDRSRLLIAGVISGMFFAAGISLLMYLFQEDTMIILGTLMGNLGRVFTVSEWNVFLVLGALCLIILVWLYRRSTALDVISGGDVFAGSVGIDVHRSRRQIFVLTSLLVGIVVSYAGIIGFVGLIIPHTVRLLAPGSQRRTYPLALWLGGIFLVLCDLAAQNITTIELPVGVITSCIGCPFFIWLMLRK